MGAATYELDKELTWDEVKGGSVAFALVSGEKVLYGSGNQNIGFGSVSEALNSDNAAITWKVESKYNGTLFHAYAPSGASYSIWGGSMLNAQPSIGGVTFILGTSGKNNDTGESWEGGQDMANGAVWTVTAVSGGYTIQNKGNNGYLNGSNTSTTAEKVWKFYSIKESTASGDTPSSGSNSLLTTQDDSETDKCTISQSGGVTTYTTVSSGVNILFKNKNVDVTGYNQVKITFAEETDIELIFSAGSNVNISAHSKSFTYDIPSGKTSLDELTLVEAWQGSGKVVKISSIEFLNGDSNTKTITVDGTSRSYYLYVPDNVGTNPALVFSLHGASGHSSDYSPFGKAEADKKGCIVVYPQGLDQYFAIFGGYVPGWNATGENNEDIKFFKAIIEDVKKYHAFDAKRVYCCGFSNGGMMTYAAANAASDVFAAFAAISGFPMNEFHLRHAGASPRPFLHLQGKEDSFVKYEYMPTIRDNMVARLGANPIATSTTVTGKYTKNVYAAGTNGFPYIYYEIDGMGHSGYTSNTEDNNSTLTMWNFFNQYTLDSDCDATLKWNPNLDKDGFTPSKHGWTVTDNKTFKYGDATPTANPNVSHSLQFAAGDYQLRFQTTGTAGNKITINLKNVNGTAVFTKEATVGQKQYISYNIPAYGEYTITIAKASANDKFSSLGAYMTTTAWEGATDVDGNSSATEPVGPEDTDLTASLFHEWTGVNADATVKTDNVYGACVLNESTGLPYGNGNVPCTYYADLSSYGKLVVTVTDGEPRFLFNRAENDGDIAIEYPRDKDSKPYETVVDNGDGTTTYTINLAAIVKKYGYAHLNAIKGANWANVTVTSMKLEAASESEVDPEPEVPVIEPSGTNTLTADMYYEWTAADATGEQVKKVNCAYNLNVSSGTIYGEGNINILYYADLSKVDKLYVIATDGVPRGIFNKVSSSSNALEVKDASSPYLTIVDKGNGIKEYVFDIAAITDDYGYAHLHAIKAYDYQSSTTVQSITYTLRSDSGSSSTEPEIYDFTVGDVNNDNNVSIEDLAVLVDDLKNNTENVRDDVNEDNVVDIDDASALADIILGNEVEYEWVSTWASAQLETTESNGALPSIGLANNSIRQIVQVSVGGKKMKLKLSNEWSSSPVEIKAVEIAIAKTEGRTPFVYESTTKSLTFGGNAGITIAAGKMVESDPISFNFKERENIAITIHYGACESAGVTGHPGSRTTSYIVSGNSTNFSAATTTDHWYHICAIDVVANKDSRAVAILGNSITDGRGSTTNKQNRWTDNFSRALLANESTKDVSVLNLGIGGNLVTGGLGPAAYKRFDRDILQQAGVKYAIIFIGTNDVGYSPDINGTYNTLVTYFTSWVEKAHTAGIKIYGATITPFKNSSHYTTDHETLRQKVNEWIRTCGLYDAVIDFDKIMRDPSDPESMPQKYFMDGTDGLHANAEGYLLMGNSVDLKLFEK